MGLLIDGVWHERQPEQAADGISVSPDSAFRNWVTPDGRPGPTGHDGFAAAKGRYHLYVSLACPWAHRTLILRALKGLEDVVSVSVTHWFMGEQGWTFTPGEGVIPDPLFNSRLVYEIYLRADSSYTGVATVPLLWDCHTQAIVNNDPTEIMRMFNSAFDGLGVESGDYYPVSLRSEIDTLNAKLQDHLADGVYKAGFATTQRSYESAVSQVFDTLDWLENRLSKTRLLCGDRLTEVDIRLFTILVRFDVVYHGHFKCNLRRLTDYRYLWAYVRDVYQWPGIAATVDFRHIKRHYYTSYTAINSNGVVPLGPIIDFEEPAQRGRDIARLLTF